jgi:DNA invertase Pin-like site-specific DNA recombinase
MAAARKGELDCVICWKLDRFGRSLIDLHSRLRELQTLGVRFVASTQGIDIKADVNDPVARLHFNLLGAYAEFERELIVERTNLGLDVARRRGVRLGRPSKAVDMEKVRDMRGAKKSWDAIASELGVARSTVQAAVERDAKLLAKSSGVPNTAALRSFVERGQAAQRAVDELVGREAVPS